MQVIVSSRLSEENQDSFPDEMTQWIESKAGKYRKTWLLSESF